MTDDEELHSCITKFMLATCRYATTNVAFSDVIVRVYLRKVFDVLIDSAFETFTTGSSAEFYITPPLPHIGDTDTMFCYKRYLTIPAKHRPPAELPSHYRNRSIVDVFEIIDSHQPGYVYLKPSYVLRKTEDGIYVAESREIGANELQFYFKLQGVPLHGTTHDLLYQHAWQQFSQQIRNDPIFKSTTVSDQAHGPALSNKHKFADYEKESERIGTCNILRNTDTVLCVRCLTWPPQAAEWRTRSRSHRWPDPSTIDMIVKNACDVVQVAHPRCRQDEWMSKSQWRFSFSRAEVTLLNSWSPVQQIIYHMLRFVLKCEVLSKTHDLPKLSNYHIKTLMLWESEQKPHSWWSAESSFVKLCSSLLYKLCDWVADERCQQYFITSCNLLDHFVDDASLAICNSLMKLADESFLLNWFVTNYVGKYAQYHRIDVLSDVCSSEILKQVMHAAIDNRMNTSFRVLSYRLACEGHLSLFLHAIHFNAEWSLILLQELQNYDMGLRNYFNALAYLHVSYTVSVYSATESMLNVLWTLFDPSTAVVNDTITVGPESSGVWCIRRAIKLATYSGVRSNALEMLHNEMSKAYLHHSFVYGQESTYHVVHVLLAGLYYKSGHYQEAIKQCQQVLNQDDRGRYPPRSIGAEYLPHIDKNVDIAFGLKLLYQYVQQNALNQERSHTNGKLAFTADLLAQYLYSKCTADSDVRWAAKYRQRLFLTEKPFLIDVLLFMVVKRQPKECTDVSAEEYRTVDAQKNDSRSVDTTMLVTTLELVALEQLITVRQQMVRELHSEHFPVLNEFEVLYAYKCGLFEYCLEICEHYVRHVFRAGFPLHQVHFVGFPEFLSLLDGKLVSLWGVIRLLHPDPLPLLGVYMNGCGGNFAILTVTLSLYLMAQSHRKLRSKSVRDTLHLVRFARDRLSKYCNVDVDILVLKLTYRSLKLYSDDSASADKQSIR